MMEREQPEQHRYQGFHDDDSSSSSLPSVHSSSQQNRLLTTQHPQQRMRRSSSDQLRSSVPYPETSPRQQQHLSHSQLPFPFQLPEDDSYNEGRPTAETTNSATTISGDSPHSPVVSALERSSGTFLLNDSYGEVLVEDEIEDDEEDEDSSVASRARGRVGGDGGVWIPKTNKPENESNPYSNSMGSNDEQEEVSQQRQRNRVPAGILRSSSSSSNSSPFLGAGDSSRLRVSTDGETTCATPPLVATDPSTSASSTSSSSLSFASISPFPSLPTLDRSFLSSTSTSGWTRHLSSIPPSQSSDSAFSSHSHSHSPLSTSFSHSLPHDSGTTMPNRPPLHHSSTPHSFQPPPSHLFWNEQFQQLVERIDDIDDRVSDSEAFDKDDDCCDPKKKNKGEDSEDSKEGKSEKDREREGDDISLKIELQRELERYKQLRRLASDFVDVAEKYGTVIISEYHLPTNLKTIKPAVELKGIAGGSKYFCAGILFKFANDVPIGDSWIYGGKKRDDFLAMKSVNHELKGVIGILQANIEHLCGPLMAIIDYRGHRLCAMSYLPISGGTLAYGSSDAGVTVHRDDPILENKVMALAKKLNLKGHMVRVRALASEVFLWGPSDMEGHKGVDGRYYLVDLSRLYPPEAPSLSVGKQSIHSFKLRPEFIAKHSTPLSSDAFSNMEGSSREESSSEVLAATRRLHNEVIPKFARHLDRQKVSHFAFVEELHRAGINVRHIGTVLSHTRSPSSRSVVLTEMILRVMKYIIRKAFRDSVEFSTYPSKDALHEILVEYFNLLFLRNDQSAEFWNAPERTLRSQMHHQFQFVYGKAVVPKIAPTPTSDTLSSSFSSSSSTALGVKQSAADAEIRDEVDIKALFEKLQLALGFKITERARRSFEQGNGEYEFLVEDVERIQPVVKHSHLVDLATGVSLYFKAKARENWDHQSDVLLSLAVQSLVSALRSAPFDQAASFYLAQCYYQQMKRTNNDEEKLKSLLVDVLEKFSLAQKYGWHLYLCYRCMFKSNYLAAQRTQNDEYFQSAGALLCEMLDHSGDKKPESLTFLKELVEKAVAKQRTTLLDALHLALYCEPFKAMLQERFHSFILEGCAHIPLAKMKRVLQGKFEIMWLSFTQCFQVTNELIAQVVDTLDLRKLDRVSFFGCFQVNRRTLDLISCCQEITSLDLSGCLLLRSEDMEFIISSFPNLKRIAIRDCTALNGHDVRVFLSKCPLLEKLDATGVPVRYNYELNEVICTQLKILAADFNWKCSEVLRLAEVCPLLEDMSLPFVEASDTLLCQIAKLLPNLTAIGLNCENISSSLSDNSLKSFGNYCPKISKFNIASHGFTKQGLIRFAEKCTEQVNIGTLSRSKRFDHEVFAEYVKYCPNLSRLIFRHLDGKKKNSISEHAWKKPMLQLKKLISLKLNRCVFDEQTFLQPLFRARGSDIEAIYFYNCSFSGKALQTLAQQASRLSSLHFINSSVNAESITAFSKALSFNNCLEQMAIVACKKISETSVIELLKKTPRIRSVELQNLSTTEKVVGVIAKKCQLLRRLVLVSTRLNEQCLIELSSLPSLTQLTLKECQGATTAGLAFLFSNELLNDFDLQKIVVLNSMIAKVQTHFDAAVLLFQESRKEGHPLRSHSRRLFLRASVSRFQRALQMTQCTLDEVIKAVFSSSFSPSLLLSASNTSSSTTQLPYVPLSSSSSTSAPGSPSLVRSNSTPFPASVSCCTMQQLYFLQLWPELVGHVSQCFKETTTLIWKNGGDDFVGNEELVNMFENNKITNIFITASNPSTTFLQKMSRNWHGLTSLELRSCDAITDSVLTTIAENCRWTLTRVVLPNCKNITDEGVLALANPSLEYLDLTWKFPEHRFVTFDNRETDKVNITDKSISVLATMCSHLKSVRLYGRGGVTLISLSTLLKGPAGVGLTEVDVRQNEGLNGHEFVKLLRTCHALMKLKVPGTIQGSTIQLITHYPFISTLQVLHIEKPALDVKVAVITKLLREAPQLHSLTLLHKITDFRSYCSVLDYIGESHSWIKKLRMSFCKTPYENMTRFISKCKNLTVFHKRALHSSGAEMNLRDLELKELHLELCQKVQFSPSEHWNEHLQLLKLSSVHHPASLTSISKCRNLRVLSLIMSPLLLDVHLLQLFPQLPQLESIELDGCMNITDESVICLSRSCPAVSHLSLNMCTGVHNISASAIGKYLLELVLLRLYLSLITPDAVSSLIKIRLPNCTLEYSYLDMEDGDQHQIIGRVVSQADLDSCIRRSIAGQSLKGSIRGNLHNHSRLRRSSKKAGNKTGSGREGGGTEGNPQLSSNTDFTIGASSSNASSLTASSESDISLFGSTSSLDGNVTPTTNAPSSSSSSSSAVHYNALPTAVNVSELLGVGLVEGEVVVLEPTPK